MKRPLGVTLSAVGLGFVAAFTLLFAVMMTITAFAVRGGAGGVPPNPAGPPPPSPAILFGVILATSLVAAAIGAWEVFTIVGLVRLRNWARYSILVIGGLLTFLGLCSVLGIFLAAFVVPGAMADAKLQQSASPHLMQIVLIVCGLFYGAIAGVGIWWLVYFNLRGTRQAFTTAYAIDPVFYPGEAQDPQLYRATGRFARTPTSVMVIAWLFLLSGLCCLAMCWLPLPAYVMGVVLTGIWPHLLYLVFGLLAALIGWGLMNLDNRARLGVYGLTVYGLVNFATMLTPWGRARYIAYNTMLYQKMQLGPQRPQPLDPSSFGFLLAMFLFCVVFYGVVIWLLERHKRAFTVVPPPLG